MCIPIFAPLREKKIKSSFIFQYIRTTTIPTMKPIYLAFLLITFTNSTFSQKHPVRVGVVGLTHSHVHWILSRPADENMIIVGIVEPNRDLAQRYTKQHGLSMDLVYNTMKEMLSKAKPEAVMAFGTIYDHLKIVKACAPLGIHVMVEKPLAVSLDHAKKMQALAKKFHIHLLTNYETSWYPTVEKSYELLQKDSIGPLTQMVIRDGHRGPKRINVNKEFFDWLTDPVLDGGGAITDFGCYGANISTWFHKGERPLSVTAVTQQLQKENNPKVDDEATILVLYKKSKSTIQASWNWPIGRKDMEVYGTTGAIFADNRNSMRVRKAVGYDGFTETSTKLEDRKFPYTDPFTLFAAVIRNEYTLPPFDLYSLENNMIVMEILEAAKTSAKKGVTVKLK